MRDTRRQEPASTQSGAHRPAPDGSRRPADPVRSGDSIRQGGGGVPTRDSLLRLQRERGNRFVGRVLGLARQSAADAEGGEVSPEVESSIQRAQGGGQPLGDTVRARMEPTFGADFSAVRIHTGDGADQLNRQLSARAFTAGSDIFFGQGEYNPGSSAGRELLAHELTHVVQGGGQSGGKVQTRLTVGNAMDPAEQEAETVARQVVSRENEEEDGVRRQIDPAAGGVIRRLVKETENTKKLRSLLDDDQENEAIALMGKLGDDEVKDVLASREFRELAIDAFNNDEMYRGVKALKADLYPSLEWMFDEGTDWEKVKDMIPAAPSGQDRVRADNWMKGEFVGICDNDEMADAVDLLGGTLAQKLAWMKAEGTSWTAIRKKIVATGAAAEKTALYGESEIRDLFVSECNDEEMAEAVRLLGGSLLQRLHWLVAEEVSAGLIFDAIRRAPDAELADVRGNKEGILDALRRLLNSANFQRAEQMVTQGLLHWEDIEKDYTEQHYEQKNPTAPWKMKEFSATGAYELRYTRTDLRVIVRIRLKGEEVPAAQRTIWLNGIQTYWKDKFHIENDRRLPILFEPSFTEVDPHHVVKVHGDGENCSRANMTNWCHSPTFSSRPDTVAHEFGHMLALEDEYNLATADYTRLMGTAPPAGAEPAGGYTLSGIMGDKASGAQQRHLVAFLTWLNAHRLPGEKLYRLMPGSA